MLQKLEIISELQNYFSRLNTSWDSLRDEQYSTACHSTPRPSRSRQKSSLSRSLSQERGSRFSQSYQSPRVTFQDDIMSARSRFDIFYNIFYLIFIVILNILIWIVENSNLLQTSLWTIFFRFSKSKCFRIPEMFPLCLQGTMSHLKMTVWKHKLFLCLYSISVIQFAICKLQY